MTDVLVERSGFLASLEGLLGEALEGAGRLVFLGGEAGVFRKVRDALSESAMVLLLEDVHWADEATLDVLRFLGRRLGGCRLMILATFRSEEVGRDHPLTMVLGELAGWPGVIRMQLPALSAAGVRQLVDAAGSALDPDAVFSRTGGNPFYVTEVLASGAETVPVTVRDAVLARVARLSRAGQDVAGAASVLGRRAEADLLAAVSGQQLAAVDECVDRGVLVVDSDGVGFRHELARLAVEQSLPQAERTVAHAQALAQLLARGSPDDRRLAHHAAGASDRAAVVRHAPRAAARAARLGAHREAAGQLQLALRYYQGPDRPRAGLLDQLSYEYYLTDQLARARASGLEALAIYEREQDSRATGVSQRWLSRLSWFLGQNDDSERYAEAAVATLEPLGPSRDLAMAYSNLAQLRMLAYDTAAAVRWGDKAIGLARDVGDREAEMHALNNVGTAMSSAGDMTEGRARLARSLDLALADDAHEHAARAYTNLGSTAVSNRSLTDADQYLTAGITYCTDRDLDTWRLYMTGWLARSQAEQGRYAAAERHLADVLRHPNLSPVNRVSALPLAGVLAARCGRDGTAALDEALPIAIQTGESQRLVPVAAARAEAAWIAGRTGDLGTAVDLAWPAALAHPQPWDLGELAWWLSLAGERRPLPAPVAQPFAIMLEGGHRAAAAQWQALGCPLWSAYALALSPATADARECLDILAGLGATAVRQAVLRERHARGLRVPRGPRQASRTSPAGLTARETEVLALLADGLSYAEVAERLVLSEKTVGHHVSSVLRKLREPTRSRAVAAALRLGVIPPR